MLFFSFFTSQVLNTCFNVTLGEKLLDHLNKLSDLSKQPQKLGRDSEEQKIAAAIIGTVCACACVLTCAYVCVCMCLCACACVPVSLVGVGGDQGRVYTCMRACACECMMCMYICL